MASMTYALLKFLLFSALVYLSLGVYYTVTARHQQARQNGFGTGFLVGYLHWSDAYGIVASAVCIVVLGLLSKRVQPKRVFEEKERSFIVKTLEESRGIVFGEEHSSVAPIKLLLDNMEAMKTQNVKYFFTEWFSVSRSMDVAHCNTLNKFALEDFVADARFRYDKNVAFERGSYEDKYIKLLRQMKEAEIKIVPIDKDYQHGRVKGRNARTVRAKRLNDDAVEIISNIMDDESKTTAKAIVLVGAAHAGDRLIDGHEKVQGIGTLLGWPSYIIHEKAWHKMPTDPQGFTDAELIEYRKCDLLTHVEYSFKDVEGNDSESIAAHGLISVNVEHKDDVETPYSASVKRRPPLSAVGPQCVRGCP